MKYQASEVVSAALEQLGGNIAAARRRRKLSQTALAQRAGVSRDTVHRAERGGAISTDALGSLLMVLNTLEDFSSMLSPLRDSTGRALEEQALRVRRKRGEA